MLNLPSDKYNAEWIYPPSATVLKSEGSDHAGGLREMKTAAYRVDIALRIKNQ